MFSRNRTKTPKGLEQLLLEDPLALFSLFSQMKSSDCDAIGEAIGHIFLANHRSPDLLVLCATEEIFSTDRTEQLLRQDNIYIVILQKFVKARGRNWLYQTLRKPLRKIMSPDFSIEIDKMRLPANEDLSINRNNLEQTIRSVLDPIFDHPENLPPEIGALCCLLFRLTDQKFPGEGYKVLSGSLFLRFICPFISSPQSWHLLTRHEIKPETRRKFILVAKVVQGIANEITEFNEGYMNQIHNILVEYIEKLHVFHDKLMQISPPLESIAWESIKEKKSTTPHITILKEFFLNNFSNIRQEVIQPLYPHYQLAELFGNRLELLLRDSLPFSERTIDEETKNSVESAVNNEVKELRKIKGKKMWQSLLHDLVDILKLQEELGEPIEILKFQIVHCYSPNDFKVKEDQLRNAFPKGFKLRRRSRKRRSKLNTASVILPGPPETIDVYKPTQSLITPGEIDTFTELSDFHTELSETSINGEETYSLLIWLQQLEFGEYYQLFCDAGITEVQQILPLTDQQLLEIGIEAEKIRNQIKISANESQIAKAPTKNRKRKVSKRRKRRTSNRKSKKCKTKKELEEEAVAIIIEP